MFRVNEQLLKIEGAMAMKQFECANEKEKIAIKSQYDIIKQNMISDAGFDERVLKIY